MKKTRFRGHETFYFREGWISKALFEMNTYPESNLFKSAQTMTESIAKLGIGANMVSAIKYWLISCGLIILNRRERRYCLTELGMLIANNDIYLEDTFSLWLLHINLVNNYENATTWFLFFNKFKAELFSKDDVYKALNNYCENNDIEVSEKAISNDLSVLLSMYSKDDTKEDPEDNISCPLAQLGLILHKSNHLYERITPALNKIHEYIILYAILRLIEISEENDGEIKNHISIDRLEEGSMSLTNVFGISRVVIAEYLDRLASQGWIRIEKTAGLNMIYLERNVTSLEIANRYYEEEGGFAYAV